MKTSLGFRIALLVLLAALGVGGAWWAVIADKERQQKRYFQPRLLFPSLAARSDDIGAIRIDVGKGLAGVQHMTFVRTAKNQQEGEDFFRIIERGSYVVRADMIRRLMAGMAGLKIISPRSSTREGHQRLGLLPPEELGASVRIVFYGHGTTQAGGKTRRSKIAGILIGKRPEGLDNVLGQSSVYVRLPGKKQSWLARGSLPLRLNANDWLDFDFFKRFLEKKIDKQDFIIAKAQFVPFGKPAWRMTRSDINSAFSVTDTRGVPVRGVVDANRVNAIAKLLNGLVFQNVRPVEDLRFQRRHTAIYESFSGLAIVLEIIRGKDGYWARINARATSRKAERLAQSLDRYLDGQAFLLPYAAAQKMILPASALFKKTKRRPQTKKKIN